MAHLPQTRPFSGALAPVARPTGLLAFLDTWRQRKHLADLDPHLLKDIGLDGVDVHREVNRPIWDAPEIWRL